jgi:hypothetical protein
MLVIIQFHSKMHGPYNEKKKDNLVFMRDSTCPFPFVSKMAPACTILS